MGGFPRKRICGKQLWSWNTTPALHIIAPAVKGHHKGSHLRSVEEIQKVFTVVLLVFSGKVSTDVNGPGTNLR
jgi:hypothetical protein